MCKKTCKALMGCLTFCGKPSKRMAKTNLVLCFIFFLIHIAVTDLASDEIDYNFTYLPSNNVTQNNTEARDNDEAYNLTKVNGNFSTPELPASNKNMTVFLLPKTLNPGDKIYVTGSIATFGDEKQSFDVSLVCGSDTIDYNNVPLKFSVNFIEGSYSLSTIQDGNEEVCETEPIEDIIQGQEIHFHIKVEIPDTSVPDSYSLDLYYNNSSIGQTPSRHHLSAIRYLTLQHIGHVRSLSFEFAPSR